LTSQVTDAPVCFRAARSAARKTRETIRQSFIKEDQQAPVQQEHGNLGAQIRHGELDELPILDAVLTM
jgi:hypothetical protein